MSGPARPFLPLPGTPCARTPPTRQVGVRCASGHGDTITSSITREAAEELGLAEGVEVTVVIKASDVLLATGD